MTSPPMSEGTAEEGSAEEAPAAAVVCVSSEAFLEKRGRDGEWRGRSATVVPTEVPVGQGILLLISYIPLKCCCKGIL